MSDQTKTILISAALVAGIYIFSEFFVKPRVARATNVKVK